MGQQDERSQLTREMLIQEYEEAACGNTISLETATDIFNTMQVLNPRTLAGYFLKENLTSNQVWSGSEYFNRWSGHLLSHLSGPRVWMQIVEQNEQQERSNTQRNP